MTYTKFLLDLIAHKIAGKIYISVLPTAETICHRSCLVNQLKWNIMKYYAAFP